MRLRLSNQLMAGGVRVQFEGSYGRDSRMKVGGKRMKVGGKKNFRYNLIVNINISESFMDVIHEQYEENQWKARCIEVDSGMRYLVRLVEECNMTVVDTMKDFLVHA
ncbi:hypothetical protein FHG87_016991 [Trinorchestia longiramus]|nr:hypothetical protein FHG87_016991 [Trinorchestia longiramus]